MNPSKLFSKVSMMIFLIFFHYKVYGYNTFRVENHGDVEHGKFYKTNSFLDSWQEACQSESGGTVSVPAGTIQLDPIEFAGPCKNQVTFQLDGTLQAPTGITDVDDWIRFRDIDGLIIQGSGTLDGQGSSAWSGKCPSCPPLTTSLTLSSVTNAQVRDITSINSKGYHIKVNKGSGTTIEHVTITAPEDSPNTDGIHTSETNNINILNSNIGTGDDCISIGEGTQNINITGINCGPGHGISIGSIGKNLDDGSVSGVHVTGCTISSTENGVRIKTWTSDCQAIVSDVTFQDITIDQASNPIIIDQQYCGGSHDCGGDPSHVQVSDVKFINVHGTSKTPVAVNLQCSSTMPCQRIELDTIDLSLDGGEQTTSSCSNVNVVYNGPQNPPSCSNLMHHY